MDETSAAPPTFAYCTEWNEKLRKPVLGRVWLSEAEARESFEKQHYFQVLDRVALNGGAPSFILEIRTSDFGRISAHIYNSAGSIRLKVNLRPEDGRYFCDQVRTWTYPDEDSYYGMNRSTAITTTRFEPDGTGTFTLRDDIDPSNDMRLEARDIPVAEHWIDRFAFGEWDVLLNLPMLKPSHPLIPPTTPLLGN